jgi:hypothetical protein|tara:strand:- start:458 stop:652 length:195 start_codon:yes stop_codon:yes gene_type:complete
VDVNLVLFLYHVTLGLADKAAGLSNAQVSLTSSLIEADAFALDTTGVDEPAEDSKGLNNAWIFR